MIRRRKSQLILFLSLQAMAVAIICFGSLINFHQYKIWGKPLIPSFVGYKRDVEKFSKTVSFVKVGQSKLITSFDVGIDADCPCDPINTFPPAGDISSPTHEMVSCELRFLSATGLRGPPLA